MLTIRTAAVALALFTAVAAPAPALAQSAQAELNLAHAFLDGQLDYALRSQLGSVDSFLTGDEGFTQPELAALQTVYSRELETTIRGAQDIVAKAASDAFTEAELRDAASISNERWQTVLGPLQDQLYSLGAGLAARAIIGACGSVSEPSEGCKAYTAIAQDFLSGSLTIQELQK